VFDLVSRYSFLDKVFHKFHYLYLFIKEKYIFALVMSAFSNKIEKNDIVVAGARATGSVHIGNYYGAIKNFVELSKLDNKTFYFIADLHSLTTHADAVELAKNNYATLATYLGCGLDVEKATVYFQSDVPYTSELYLYLNMYAYMGELERTATFKDKARAQPENVNAGLLTYPVLMAADVLLHKGTKVPVGKDQSQHVEMIRDFSNRFNYKYNKQVFKEAIAYTYTDEMVNIPSLSGQGKMSKSDDVSNAIFLLDSDADIEKKFKRAVSDSGPTEKNSELSPVVKNLFAFMDLFSSPDTKNEYLEAYSNCTIRYGDMKKQIAADAIKTLAPIRENIEKFMTNPNLLQEIAKNGAEKANASAKITLEEIRDIMGLTRKNIKK
jgi:tryptophanyl-tRNA synthetase